MRFQVLLLSCAALPSLSGTQPAHTVTHAGGPLPPSDSAPRLGAVGFPTSATPAAHAAFLRGVLYLHSFHYPEAGAAFRRARTLDPGDAMSAAFEALSWTGPVWNIQDTARARAVLRSFAATREARLARARTQREHAWVGAVEALYEGDTPKAVRDTAFSRAMARLHASDPRDPEAATLYALSLLGLNQGEREPRAYAAAEAIVDTVLRSYPRHPGALHYKIHSVDDPGSARRGLAAARAYGDVAPGAGHALHMTSHVYIALGMWDDVVRANTMAAATRPYLIGHTSQWLAYGLVQQGRWREARRLVDSTVALMRAGSGSAGAPGAPPSLDELGQYAALIPGAYVADAEAWDTPLARLRPDTSHLTGVNGRTAADFIAAFAAARRAERAVDVTPGSRAADRAYAESALARMSVRIERARAAGARGSGLGDAAVMMEILAAELAWGAGRQDTAVAMLRAAAARWEALPFAFGPPAVLKPPRERAAELLLFMGRPAEALTELQLAERMTPGRTQAMLRRARALDALGRRAEAARVYARLDSIWRGADVTFPNREEARAGSGALAAAPGAVRVNVDTITYPSGALRLRGTLYRPSAAGRTPVVVVLHGSTSCWRAVDAELLGRLFAKHGYAAFFPCRRGLGLSRGQGEPILDQLRREGFDTRDTGFAARSTELLATREVDDVRAAIAAARAHPGLDPSRTAVAGVSYGGILTMLAAESDSTLRAAVAFAPAAMNWSWNAPLRARLTAAARRTVVPTRVIQAANDWSAGPTEALPKAMRAARGNADGWLYPAVGENANDGHALIVTAPSIWERDVFTFLGPLMQSDRRTR